jgi:hypothetical protein
MNVTGIDGRQAMTSDDRGSEERRREREVRREQARRRGDSVEISATARELVRAENTDDEASA